MLRDAVKLRTSLDFLNVAHQIRSSNYLLYDSACGTDSTLTVPEDALRELADKHGKVFSTHLYGQEIRTDLLAVENETEGC